MTVLMTTRKLDPRLRLRNKMARMLYFHNRVADVGRGKVLANIKKKLKISLLGKFA